MKETASQPSENDQTHQEVEATPTPPPAEAPAATASSEPETGIGETPGPEISEQILQARQAFWMGDFEKAVRLYRNLLAHREAPETWGELGNVYFRMGQWQDAARSYARAAELYAGRGDTARAMQLLSIVGRIDPQAADALAEQLRMNP